MKQLHGAALAARPAGGVCNNTRSNEKASLPSARAIAVDDCPGQSITSGPTLEARGADVPEVRLSPVTESRLLFWNSPESAMHQPPVIAAVTGVSVDGLRNMRAAGDGPAYRKIGARVYYRGGDVIEWMRGG